MKKLILTVASVAIVTSSYAQPKKGDWMVGVQLFPISAKGGYFLSNRLVVGTELAPNAVYQPHNNVLSANISVEPYIRYYFSKREGLQANKFCFFADYNFSYSYGFSRDFKNKVGGSNDFITTGIAPGLVYLITDRVSADAAIRVNYYGIGNAAPSNQQFGTQYEVGMQVYLKGKKKKASDISEMRGS